MIAHSDKEGVTDHCRCRREKDTVRALSVRADEIFCKKNLLSLLVLNDAYREGGTVTPAGRNWRRWSLKGYAGVVGVDDEAGRSRDRQDIPP